MGRKNHWYLPDLPILASEYSKTSARELHFINCD
jgi:hypothetical protein